MSNSKALLWAKESGIFYGYVTTGCCSIHNFYIIAQGTKQAILPLDTEFCGDFGAVKAHHYFAVDYYDGDTELAGHFYHLLALLRVACDVVTGVLHAFFGKERLGRLAKVARRRGVDYYAFVFHIFLVYHR